MTSVRYRGGSAAQAGRLGALAGVLTLVRGARDAPEPAYLAPDVQAWLASPEDALSATIRSARGAGAASDALKRLAPSSLMVLGAVASDHACWAELARRASDAEEGCLAGAPVDAEETCLAGASVDAAGQISRLVWLRAPLAPGPPPSPNGGVPDARPILERYFADLMSSRFRHAAGHFTADTIYSHPPYAGGTERVLFQGRQALWRGFVEERGSSPARQIITDLWQQGSRVFVEGVVEGIPNGGSFFSTAQITPEGEIARYVAFYVARRLSGAAGP